ncbi:MAG: BatA domain-containing protein [Myxococcales bacterium]|nr:BatA domain-containing protein [Myxococcales bacterium]
MTFAQPWMLLGLLGGLIPIIIHLIHRFRPRTQPFPAMELLLRSVKRVERRWRIRRFILLSLRVLILSAFALAAAKPLIGTAPMPTTANAIGPERVAIVIDASLSMRAQYRERSAFSRAIDAAQTVVDELKTTDQALIVVAGNPPQLPLAQPTGDRGRLHGILSRLQPHWRPSLLSDAVSAATEALGRTPEGSHDDSLPAFTYRVVVLSDFSKNTIDGPANFRVSGSEATATLQLVNVLRDIDPNQRENYGIVNAASEVVPSGVSRMVALHTRVRNYGEHTNASKAHQRSLELRTSQEISHRINLDIVPGTMTESSLRHTFSTTGTQFCILALEPDRLQEDNTYYIRVNVRKYVRSLIVDGDPSGIEKEDEVFYLERAHSAGSPDQPTPRIISADDLSRADLHQFDVVVLAGVPFLSKENFDRLVRFVQEGGGLWITLSEGFDARSYKTGLQDLLPGKFGEMRFARENEVYRFIRPQLNHPVLKLFEGEPLSGLLTTKTRAYVPFVSQANNKQQILLRFRDRSPALLLHEVPSGRVALLTTSIDRDLTDLAIRPSFVPLVRQTILWLGKALTEPEKHRTYVGDTYKVKVPAETTKLQVRAPSGRVTTFRHSELAHDHVLFSATDEPGFYEVHAQVDQAIVDIPSSGFAVNVDPSESDLRPTPLEDAYAILRGERSPQSRQASHGSIQGQSFGSFGQDQLTRILLILMGLAFLLESGLTASRIGR